MVSGRAQVDPAAFDRRLTAQFADQSAHIAASGDRRTRKADIFQLSLERRKQSRVVTLDRRGQIIDHGMVRRSVAHALIGAVVAREVFILDGLEGHVIVEDLPAVLRLGLELNVLLLYGGSDHSVLHRLAVQPGALVQVLQVAAARDNRCAPIAPVSRVREQTVGRDVFDHRGLDQIVIDADIDGNGQIFAGNKALEALLLGKAHLLALGQVVQYQRRLDGPCILNDLIVRKLHLSRVPALIPQRYGKRRIKKAAFSKQPVAGDLQQKLIAVDDLRLGVELARIVGKDRVAAVIADLCPLLQAVIPRAQRVHLIGIGRVKIRFLLAVENGVNARARRVILDDPMRVPQLRVHLALGQDVRGGRRRALHAVARHVRERIGVIFFIFIFGVLWDIAQRQAPLIGARAPRGLKLR